VVILLDHARNAGIGSSCESRQRAPCFVQIRTAAPKIQAFAIERGGDVAPAGNGGKNLAAALTGDQCEQDHSPLKRRNRLPDLWEIRSYPSA